jgi:hypothetical protein
MRYSAALKSFTPDFLWFASRSFELRRRKLVRTIFKLKSQSTAILPENDRRSVIPIPASAMVVLVGGNIDEDAFVKIRYEGKVLLMLSEDLRNGGELWGRSA